ncbi:hypothetical protein [Comamonas sp. 4034]|uniref:hypothetical protein n=1 Tax=Comamonas sp. 4034 TaxID=3156455 RepID=UPI003D2220FF
MTTPDPSREAFEKHVLTENGIYVRGKGWITRNTHGGYEHEDIQERWLTWQAAMAHKGRDKCVCTFSQRMVGDGCRHCNPQEYIDVLLAQIDEHHSERWQPIETAPKDGTTILLLCTSGGIADGCWDLRDESWNYAYIDPTHWQPLPATPKQEGGT